MIDECDGSEFDEDELLSMGQSDLVLKKFSLDRDDEDCSESIYLSSCGSVNVEGSCFRALALYDVKKNMLGIETMWPGKP